MPITVEQFHQRVAASGVMSEGELRDWLATVPVEQRPSDGEALARELVKQKKLTRFQAEQIYAGKEKSLTLGNYVILDKLGQGGMGMVLKAEHRRMKRSVAIKVMSPAAVKTPDALKRFHREVEAAAKLRHPNIVAADDADEAKGTHFLVMEYVDGRDLSVLVKKHGPMPVERAVNCIIQAARGLEFAHEQGVIHRDIKPANLLIDAKGTVKILDMGLARIDDSVGGSSEGAALTSTGTIMGTVDYMSPEQAMDTKHADARSDIYSLGCSLYYLLTGTCLYDGDTIMKKLMAHQHAPVPELNVSLRIPHSALRTLNAVFRCMVAKKPEDRPQSMTQVIAELERCLASDVGTVTNQRPSGVESGNALQAFFRETARGSASQPTSAKSATKASKSKSQTAMAADPALEPTMISSAGAAATDPQTLTSVMKLVSKKGSGSGWFSKRQNLVIAGVTAAVLLVVGMVWWSGSKPPSKTEGNVAADDSGKKTKKNSSGQKSEAPKPAIAPFDADQARAHQEAWAKHLGVPVEYTNSIGMKFTLIPPGEFLMGSTAEQVEVGRKLGEQDKNIKSDDPYWSFLPSETPQHQVTLTRPFWMGTTEVTISQFRKFVEATKYVTYAERYGFGDSVETLKSATEKQNVNESQKGLNWKSSGETAGDDFPVRQITWDDAAAFCAWLSEQEGLTPWYRNDDRRGWIIATQANGYRLPTEAEWEYACRAGTTTQFWHGDDVTQLAQHELYADSPVYALWPVGSKRPNPFGLFDMCGSVREWCQDLFGAKLYEQGPAIDPLGPTTGRTRSIRGGSWAAKTAYLRTANRYGTVVSNRSAYGGFRIVRVMDSAGGASD